MKKTTKRYLVSSLVLSSAFFGLLGANSIAANADGSPFNNFVISEVQVRNADPVGIRFVTDLTEAQKSAATEFGTLVIPVDLLTDENSDEAVNGFDLTYETEGAAKIETLKWLDKDGLSYAGTLVGSYTDENVWEDLPKTFYGRELVARAYAIVNEEPVLSTNYLQKSIAQASAEILASEKEDDKKPIHQTIVDYVLNGEFGFDTADVQMELGADPVAVALENKGLETVVTSGDDEIAYYANGKIYAGTKSGTTAITAKIGNQTSVVSVQVQDRTYAYGEISDMSYGADAFYHDYLAWGPSIHADLGTNYSGKINDYGVSKTLTDNEYQALLAAGYKGSKTSKTVWSTREKLHSEANERFQLHNGKAALVTLGSKSFSEKISDLLDDESVDMQGAYISVWVRTSVSVNYAYSYVNPMKAYGLYSGQHMDVQCMMTAPSGMQAANQWVELKLPVETLRTTLTSGDMKGLGFQFYLRTDTTDLTGQTEGLDGIDIDYFDIYSIELAFPTEFNGYTFAEAATVSLPALGVENFTENLEVYDGEDKLEAGVDYVYANGKLSGLAAGAYTLKNIISGDGLEQRTLVRSYAITNQVTEMNTEKIVPGGWGDAYFGSRQVVALDQKPDGYTGSKTELTAVKGNASSDKQVFACIDISALLKNINNMKDSQYLSVWLKVEADNTTIGTCVAKLANAAGETAADRVTHLIATTANNTNATGSVWLTSSHVNKWISVCFTKTQLLECTTLDQMKYLILSLHAGNATQSSIHMTVYSVELMDDLATFTNPSLNPLSVVAGGWTGYACYASKMVDTISAQPENYNGQRTANDLSVMKGSSLGNQLHMVFNIAPLVADVENWSDGDKLNVWVKVDWQSTAGTIKSCHVYLRSTVFGSNLYRPMSSDTSGVEGGLNNWWIKTETVGQWLNIQLTKEQLMTATANGSIHYLTFVANASVNTYGYAYSVDVLKA